MAKSVIDKIEYLILLVAEFAHLHKVSEVQSYRYLQQYGALALCENFIFYLLHLNHIVTLFIIISVFIDEETGTERLK